MSDKVRTGVGRPPNSYMVHVKGYILTTYHLGYHI